MGRRLLGPGVLGLEVGDGVRIVLLRQPRELVGDGVAVDGCARRVSGGRWAGWSGISVVTRPRLPVGRGRSTRLWTTHSAVPLPALIRTCVRYARMDDLQFRSIRGTPVPGINGVRPPLPGREPVLRALVDICGPDFARAGPLGGHGRRSAGQLRRGAGDDPRRSPTPSHWPRNAASPMLPRGSGSKIDWGTPSPGVDLIIDTGRLSGMWDHRPGPDRRGRHRNAGPRPAGGAGAARASASRSTRRRRTATVGGMLAVNEAGPLRHRFGTPAEQVDPDQLRGRDGRGRLSPTARTGAPASPTSTA